MRIDVSSANCRAKSHFQVRTAERNPIFRCPPLRCLPLGPPEASQSKNPKVPMTVGFLYGAGAETQIFVTGTSGKYLKIFISQQKNQSQLWIPRKPRETSVWVSRAEIPTSAVDTRTAVWVSTAEKLSKIVLGKTRNFLESLGGLSASSV